jgi:hypothetical protein
VTGALAGSALMREPELAGDLMAAAVEAVDVPVTVKMRLGWDDASRNAPDSPRAPKRSGCARSPCTAAPAASSTRAPPTGRRPAGEGRRVDPGDRQRRHRRRASAQAALARRAPTA